MTIFLIYTRFIFTSQTKDSGGDDEIPSLPPQESVALGCFFGLFI